MALFILQFLAFLELSTAFVIPVSEEFRIQHGKSFVDSFSFERSSVVAQMTSEEDDNDTMSGSVTVSKESNRAGTDGYSVMRQPLSQTNWDPNASPENEVPLLLQDDSQFSGGSSLQDEQWWLGSVVAPASTADKKQSSKPSKQQSKQKKKRMDESDQDEELDLLKRTFETLDYPRVIRALTEEYTSTMPARNILIDKQPKNRKKGAFESTAYQPFLSTSVEGSRERYRAVQEMQWILQGQNTETGWVLPRDYHYRNRKGYKETLVGNTPPIAGNSFALEPILQAASAGGLVLESPQLLEISQALGQMQDIQSWGMALSRVDEMDFVELPKLVDCIDFNSTLQELLHNAFDDKGSLSGTTFPTVGRLRARVKALRGDILQTLESLVQMPSVKSKLALESGGPLFSEVNGGRLVIPVESNSKASAIGIVHDTSRSGKTVYVEPTEIVGPTNELRQAEGELRSEEARIWRYLTEQVLINQRALETSIYAVGQLDLVLARLRLGQSWEGLVPRVEEEGVISLRNAKHPVLLLRQLDNVVGSDVDLGADGNQGLVLTGPNSGGKTVILKLLGLVALLSRGGVPVPASPGDYEPRVDYFDPVLADIGDIQSTTSDLSTFSGHMLVCKQVLENAGENALVLMDELGSGTDPAQGVAIAQALLEAIVARNARVAITTHYMQLKQLAASDDRFSVGGMQFVKGRPTYKLLPGTVGESFALAVAERLELPQSVISRATELLDSDTRQMGDLIRELEDQKALIDEQVLEMEEKKKEMARMEFELKERQMKLEKKQLTIRREEARKFAKLLEEKEQVLENVLDKLKSDPSRKLVAKSWDDIKVVKRDALNEAENVPSVLKRKEAAQAVLEEVSNELVPISQLSDDRKPDLKLGDAIVVCKRGPLFSREGTISKVMGNRAEVRVNNMNIALKLSEIALPPKSGVFVQQQQQKAKSSSSSQPKGNKRARAAQKALADEAGGSEWDAARRANTPQSNKVTMKTMSNTVDVRGCNLMEAQEKVKQKISSTLMSGRSPVIYILHGHGTGGVLKNKLRQWLRQEQGRLIKKFAPADAADGGDAHTRVELK